MPGDDAADGTGRDLLADVPHRQRRTGHSPANVDGARLRTRLPLGVQRGASGRRETLGVVHIALRTVEEKALHAVADRRLERVADDARPVGGDLRALDGVRMRAEVDDGDVGSARAAEADEL